MPPAISDDEASDFEAKEEVEIPVRKTKKASKKYSDDEEDVEEKLVVADEDEEDDDEVEGDDVYVVEAIRNHILDDNDEIRFQVKWKGYEKPSELTWEPEENLKDSATEMLSEYYASYGGRDEVLQAAKQAIAEKNASKKKRGRASTGTATSTPKEKAKPTKKARTERHPASSTPPASITSTTFKPPTGSWEEEVKAIDACEGTDGKVMVFLQWRNGQKTQHPLAQVYQRCPQKMLKFYEAHLSFTQTNNSDDAKTNVVVESSKKVAGRPGRPRKNLK